jgi:hypothetical protein
MASLQDVVAVLRALRARPSTVAELAQVTGLYWRKVYRILGDLRAAGAPLVETEVEVERKGRGGSAPTRYAITAAGLRKWLG